MDTQQLPDEPWAKVQALLQPGGWWPLLSKADNPLLLYHGLHALLRTFWRWVQRGELRLSALYQ